MVLVCLVPQSRAAIFVAFAVLSKSTDIDITLTCVSDIPTKDKPANISILFYQNCLVCFLNFTNLSDFTWPLSLYMLKPYILVTISIYNTV